MEYNTLISKDDLTNNLDNPDFVIFDCRFDLADTSKGEEAYQKSHIPGAFYAHLDNQLSSPITSITGRHPLPDPRKLAQWLASCGLSNDKQVVVYDDSFGTMAVRLWWLLRWMGHERVAVLDGGWHTWRRKKGDTNSELPSPKPGNFSFNMQPNMLLSTNEVENDLEHPNGMWLLIDARTPERHRGEAEPIDPVAGSIPNSVNLPLQQNLDAHGRFLPADQLREKYLKVIGKRPGEKTACYCGSGVTACHNILAMEIAGLPGSRLYAGSWSEWIRNPKPPIQKF